MLGHMLRLLYGFVFGTVAVPSNDMFQVATRTDMSYRYVECVHACKIFDRHPLGRVRIHVLTLVHLSLLTLQRPVCVDVSRVYEFLMCGACVPR